MRNVPPYPGRLSQRDQMLRELYNRVYRLSKRVRVIVEGESDDQSVEPWIRLQGVLPVRYSKSLLNWNQGYFYYWGTPKTIVPGGGSWILLDVYAHLYVPWNPLTDRHGYDLPNHTLMIGRDGGAIGTHDVRERDWFARATVDMSSMETAEQWDRIPLVFNPYFNSTLEEARGVEQRGKLFSPPHYIWLALQPQVEVPIPFQEEQVGSIMITMVTVEVPAFRVPYQFDRIPPVGHGLMEMEQQTWPTL